MALNRGRLVIWPTLVAFGLPLYAGVLNSFVSTTSSIGALLFLGLLVALAGYMTMGVALTVAAVVCARRSDWRSAMRYAVLPLAIGWFCIAPSTLRALVSVGDYAHLLMLWPSYQAKIRASANSREPRLIWFFWRDASDFFSEALEFLVFDESDELSLPNAKRSASWKAQASKAYKIGTEFYFEPTMPDEAQHLFGHYYTIMVDG